VKGLDLRPWRRLLPIWLPTVAVTIAAAVLFVWQTSESGGARTRIRRQIADLEAKLDSLQRIGEAASGDRQRVGELDGQFEMLYHDVFGSLDERLTGIMREVGAATSGAGLRPSSYAYSARDDRDTGFIRFTIRFSVEGEYRQIRQMLAELQSSSEFLVVDNLSLSGDEEPVTRLLQMSVSISTFLAEADEQQLRRLTGSIGGSTEGDDG
jgi:hypothetical protein